VIGSGDDAAPGAAVVLSRTRTAGAAAAHPSSVVPDDEVIRVPVPADEAHRRLAKFHAPEIVFGLGARFEAAHAAARLGARRPFLVTDAGLTEAGWADQLQEHLIDYGLRPAVWTDVTPNPKDHEVEAGHGKYAASGCDVIVALGGGSVIDAAKGIAVLAANGGEILDYEGIDRIGRPIPPVVMLPSTAGTGADVSQFCIITDTTRSIKITIMGRALVPDVSVVDPELLTTMPEWLAAATGLDALTHGIEAFLSRAHNPLTDRHALQSISLVSDHLVRTIDHPADLDARVFMAQASLEAGLAFTNAILGATHAMSHQVGGLLDLPHGVINGVLLPHVVRFNAVTAPHRYVPVARALGLEIDPRSPGEAAMSVAERIRTLADEVGVPRGLAELGVAEADLPQLARSTLADACMSTNPRTATVGEVEDLFRTAL
jgi:1,3-propanediol dehydrogenase